MVNIPRNELKRGHMRFASQLLAMERMIGIIN
jgi:hypothetical protein